MADFTNRSPFIVNVARRPNLKRTFAYSRKDAAQTYINNLREQGLEPTVDQGDSNWLVRVRREGHKDQSKTFKSLSEAEAFVATVEAEQRQGLFRDYTKGAKTTTADLIRAYIEEDCPGLKGGVTYTYMLNAMVADSNNELAKRIAQRKRELKEFGKVLTPLGAVRAPMTSLEWLNLPLTEVMPEDIEAFIEDRREYVEDSTVNRQIQLLSAVYNRQISKQRIHLEHMPLDGVRRLKFFNERDRRLVGDEEIRLMEAARREDQMLSLEARVQELAEQDVKAARQRETHYAVNRDRKAAYERAREQAIAEGFPHIPTMEAFLVFQLATAARRSEALGLFWDQIEWDGRQAKMPTSKNGRPRKLALRTDVMALLKQLPRTSDLVFDIALKTLLKAWRRICDAAGIEDLRIHDLRHEGISRAAESGLFPTILDLQAFSGHRDLRSLSRYTHLCMTALAIRADQAEAARLEKMEHNGRMRLKQSALSSLGGATATVRSSPCVLDKADSVATDTESVPDNVVVFRAFQRAVQP
ncbi:site-specific integrase [Variovorax sp. RA8]|uniref:site-specific integrase n=1 Tax=Variovorax sp. (strain JCM 16519 / RA8) TaxID=662548 RepID=UPI0013171F19|nr:site-specific integrase [Variovorax sp. RA8]VTU18251.1 integrase [Variovorax sp. RA8]